MTELGRAPAVSERMIEEVSELRHSSVGWDHPVDFILWISAIYRFFCVYIFPSLSSFSSA
jgi:hypothetical protein